MMRLRRKLLVGVFSVLAVLAVTTAGAGAYSKSYNGGPVDIRGLVSPSSQPFRCSTSYISVRQINVTAPTNYGTVKAYVTVYAYRWVNGAWRQESYGNMSPYPGGGTISPGSTVTFPGGSWASPPGYYYLQARVDIMRASPAALVGTMYINPTLASDYQTGGIQGPGYSYCYHS